MSTVLIIGCGDIGCRVGRLEQQQKNVVYGLVRSEASVAKIKELQIQPLPADLDSSSLDFLKSLIKDSIVYYFAPPPAQGITDSRLEKIVSLFSASLPAKVVFISTSGVYGDCQGAWITETHATNPQTDRAKRRLFAEKHLFQWGLKENVSVIGLRVPAIYGPNRLPIKRLQEGIPVVCEEEAPYSNRIHASDLAQICVAASGKGKAGEIYHASDGNPTTMTDYFYQIADFYNIPRPPAISMAEARQKLSKAFLSYLAESKRLSNQKMLTELEITLNYPNLAKGLTACEEK